MVAEASQPKAFARPQCRQPVPRRQELPLKGSCAAGTARGNKLQAANVLHGRQSTTLAERCLPTSPCKTHLPKEPPSGRKAFDGGHEVSGGRRASRAGRLCGTKLRVRKGVRLHRNLAAAVLSFTFEGNAIHLLPGNQKIQRNNWH